MGRIELLVFCTQRLQFSYDGRNVVVIFCANDQDHFLDFTMKALKERMEGLGLL
jgi:hypothetical protein